LKIKQIDFSKYTSVRIGGSFAVQILKDEADFAEFESSRERAIIGGGNNLLISPAPPHLAMLSEEFDRISLSGNVLSIGAATKSGKIYNFAKKQNIGGFEFLRNIPGTLGGLIKMNAGLSGASISDSLRFGSRISRLDEVVVLGADDDRVDTQGLTFVGVLYRHLALSVGAEVGHEVKLLLANASELLQEGMG